MAAPAPLSPLAPKKYPALPVIEGVRFASIAAGVRYAGRTDVTMALFDEPAQVAGVFTSAELPEKYVIVHPPGWDPEFRRGRLRSSESSVGSSGAPRRAGWSPR